jgi:hypothetical protein
MKYLTRFRLAATPTLSLSAAAGLLIALHITHITPHTLWLKTFLNSLHIFVFAAVAILIHSAIKRLTKLESSAVFIVALVASIFLGAISEAVQIYGPRDASFADLLLDGLGAAGALLVYIGLRPSLAPGRSVRVKALFGGIVLLLFALMPLLATSSAYVWRYTVKPTLISFESPLVNTFVRPQNARLSLVYDSQLAATVGQIELQRGAWPGLIIHDIWPDWTEYSQLIIYISVPGTEFLNINIRIHDRAHKVGEQLYSDRFNKTWTLPPGNHELRIPLEQLEEAPLSRAMNLAEIDGIAIFCARKDTGRTFTLNRVFLN